MSVAGVPADPPFDLDRIEAIAARLDLRQPNKEALESIIFAINRHFDLDRQPPPLEAVVDIATGVGKTYVLVSAIEYLAQDGVRNFAVVTPGRTILDKTVNNFTVGHPKSLLGGMDVRPVAVTSENFATPAMRAAMDDPEQVKLFIFTVQALLRPESKVGRKTHKFQEGLGKAFYAHLQELDDLVIFADEHHSYYGPAFSNAVRDLRPRILLGLTATPHKKTPPDQIVYRYPLAAAIADKLVKTPVLVGRRDDRRDPATKLLDGVRLLEFKNQAIVRWCQETATQPINPVMLVIAPSIAEADEITGILSDRSFAGGRYADAVLTVHSNAPDEALAALDKLEEPANAYRIVISVGMLKEGWDVKNVYVIASMRASVSDMLTEQTLGRGLRLPFGRYTDIEILDTLEVLGHERYEELLKKANVLNEQFIDWRTRGVLKRTAEGQLVPVTETTKVQAPITRSRTRSSMASTLARTRSMGARRATTDSAVAPTEDTASHPSPDEASAHAAGASIESVEEYTAKAEEQVANLQLKLAPHPDLPPLRIPQLKMTAVKSEFSLSDITDLSAFRRLGESIAADPVGILRRVTLSARIIQGSDGLRRTELVTAPAIDRIESPATLFPLKELRAQLLQQILGAPVVPARANQGRPAREIVDAFMGGLGSSAKTILSAYMDRAAAGLIQVLTEEHRGFAPRPSYGQVVELIEFNKTRIGRPETSSNRFGSFKKGIGYEGYRKSLYVQDWFDSSTERDVANILEDEKAITLWVRLQLGDLPILWTGGGREYNPDFITIDQDGIHWLVEVKMDKEMTTPEVKGKRDAARRWANYVTADEKTKVTWRYLLLSEADVETAKGSWPPLKKLGG
jgi:type III restriction enzyme